MNVSSSLCFLCHSTVDYRTYEDVREKYKDVVGVNLCFESHLCYICCHLLRKLWLFRSLCLKKSMEYPILFSERCAINLQKNNLQIYTLCPESSCEQMFSNIQPKCYKFNSEYSDNVFNDVDQSNKETNEYFELDDEKHNKEEIVCDSKPENDILDSVFNENLNDLGNFESEYSDTSVYSQEFNQNSNSDEVNVNNEVFDDCNDKIEANKDIKEDSSEKAENKKKKKKKSKKEGFIKTVLSVEEQKAELEAKRRDKKYLESKFKCYNCAMGFLFKDTYQTHMMRHEESNGEYLCGICSLRFASSSVLRAHNAVHRDRYSCTVCQRPVRGKARKCHADICHRGVSASASCHLCGRVFQDSNRLQQHLKRFHQWKNSRKTYRCNVCGGQCSTQAALRAHMIKHVTVRFPCTECSSTFSSPYTRTQHARLHHTGNQTEGPFHCALCRLSFDTRKALLAHCRKTAKHQQTCFWCEICSRSFGTRESLKRHTDSAHLQRVKAVSRRAPPTVICHLCAGSFKGVSKLNRHLKEVCEKAKLEEQLSCYYEEQGTL